MEGHLAVTTKSHLPLYRSVSGETLFKRKTSADYPGCQLRFAPIMTDMSQSSTAAELAMAAHTRRRNSLSSLLFNRQRSTSEMSGLNYDSSKPPRPSSARPNPGTNNKLMSKIRVFGKSDSTEVCEVKLDDSLAQIRSQLASMSVESLDFAARVQSLTRAVTDLSEQQQQEEQLQLQHQELQALYEDDLPETKHLSSPVATVNRSKTTHLTGRRQPRVKSNYYSASTLPLPPIERVSSHPSPLLNSWSVASSAPVPLGLCSINSLNSEGSSDSQQSSLLGSPHQYQNHHPDITVLLVDDTDSSSRCSTDIEEMLDEEVFSP